MCKIPDIFRSDDPPRAFRLNDTWTILPAFAGFKLSAFPSITLHRLEGGPPERIIYHLHSGCRKSEVIAHFFHSLEHELTRIPKVKPLLF